MLSVPFVMNVMRNSLIRLFVNLENNYKDQPFYFFHDSYGSLVFSFISVSIVSFTYFKLLNEEYQITK